MRTHQRDCCAATPPVTQARGAAGCPAARDLRRIAGNAHAIPRLDFHSREYDHSTI
jgi:hypothetical protein